MSNQKCEDHLDVDATVKIYWNKFCRKHVCDQKISYFCPECFQMLIDGGWTGGGPIFSRDVKKAVPINKET